MITVTKNGVSYIVKKELADDFKAKGYTVEEKKKPKKGKK